MAGKRGHVSVTNDEVIYILRSYSEHPANWPLITEEMKDNCHCFSDVVQQLYLKCDEIKLRRRMSDQVTKYLTMSEDLIPEEMKDLVKNIKDKTVNKYSRQMNPEKRKVKDKRKNLPDIDSRNDTGSSSFTKRRKSDCLSHSTTKRQVVIPASDSDDTPIKDVTTEDDCQGTESPKKQQKKFAAQVNREASELYIDFAKNKLPKVMNKMETCMDKYLSN